MPQDIPSYVGWVIDQKPELKATPDDIKATLQQQLTERLERLVDLALIDALPEEELPHFEKLLKHGTEAQIKSYCETEIPNMQEIISDVLLRFHADYVGS